MNSFDWQKYQREPLRFSIPLPFPEQDKQQFPWLGDGNKDRYYRIEKPLGQGGYSLAFLGFPCDERGQAISGAPRVVIKIPNLRPGLGGTATQDRMKYVVEQSVHEWALIRNRLRKCKHANPILDMGDVWVSPPPGMELPPLVMLLVTAQLLLTDAVPLDEWLVAQQYRAKIAYDDKGKQLNWHGIQSWEDWLRVVSMLAQGLSEIHKCRVIHGDIWPPNIFVTNGPEPSVKFIDFGESFLVIPSGEAHTQPDHPYRPPEREQDDSVKTEQVDVYSFGKLMLYLAIGEEKLIPRDADKRCIYGHQRRALVRDLLIAGNPTLVKKHPELLDLIMQCVEVDSVMRATMLEICDQLHDLSTSDLDPANKIDNAASRIAAIGTKLQSGLPKSLFVRLIDRKIVEVERLLECCESEMAELTGTRDDLIAGLVNLFGELKAGDSWSSMTTPTVWQRNALGLDGRYATATVQAVRRGVAVHRVYAVSVEELGIEWTVRLTSALHNSTVPALRKLSNSFYQATSHFTAASAKDGYRQKSLSYQQYHLGRFTLVLESIGKMINDWGIGSGVWRNEVSDLGSTAGLFLGLVVVPSEVEIRRHRLQNPASLMYLGREPQESDRWLMVMTDIRGRYEDEPLDDRPGLDAIGSSHAPQLRRVRVYRSVMGVPSARIRVLGELMKGSFNLGAHIDDLIGCVSTLR